MTKIPPVRMLAQAKRRIDSFFLLQWVQAQFDTLQVGSAQLDCPAHRLFDLFRRMIMVQLEDGDELAHPSAFWKALPPVKEDPDPIGLRVSANKDLRVLFAKFGKVLRSKGDGWQVAILCSQRQLLAQTWLKLDASLSLAD
jgi:hypothetical protein